MSGVAAYVNKEWTERGVSFLQNSDISTILTAHNFFGGGESCPESVWKIPGSPRPWQARKSFSFSCQGTNVLSCQVISHKNASFWKAKLEQETVLHFGKPYKGKMTSILLAKWRNIDDAKIKCALRHSHLTRLLAPCTCGRGQFWANVRETLRVCNV